jgi:stage II sporulation protein R
LKKALILVLCLALIGGVFIACDGSKPVSVHTNVIRLHILANSDSDTDQSDKLKIRDMVLKNWGSKLASFDSSKQAWSELKTLLPDIQKDIAAFLKKLGVKYGVKLETGVYDFPVRNYNGVVFPEGKYQALRIELGAATGHNWWCVMFPPLCLVGDDGNMDMEQYKDLVKALGDDDVTLENAPDAPVRSWLFDKLAGEQQWDKDFVNWAKEFWLGGDKNEKGK